MATDRPSPLQFVGYAYGRRLPDWMHMWVANDLAGQGAVRRHMIRMAIPPLLVSLRSGPPRCTCTSR